MLKKLKFPDGFLWGSSTSAHQVEGNNHNNWSEWEKENAERLAKEAKNKWASWQQKKFPEMFQPENYISGQACDHYNRYEEDFDIIQKLGHNAHRFSIEWSRIEPEEGKFDEKEIEHYRKVLLALKKRKIKTLVTLWHWTNPLWLTKKGGELNQDFPQYFLCYTKCIVSELGDLVDFWITVNEPTSVIVNSYVNGLWPPQKKSLLLALRVYKNLAQAHNNAYKEIHKKKLQAKVGFANILTFYEPYKKNSTLDKLVVKIINYFGNEKFLNLTRGNHDFLTVQYYFHNRLKFPGKIKNKNRVMSDLGWEIYPEGIYHILKNLKKYNLPIYITENGLADADDDQRGRFIQEHLRWVYKAIQENVNVKGYFYWSLLDNFEWDKGFWPRFGLVEVDYRTQERKIRSSAWKYAKICQNNELEIEVDEK